MQVHKIQNNSNYTNFSGKIKNDSRMKTAIKSALQSDKKTATKFLNTLNLIKMDNSNNILSIKKTKNELNQEEIYTSYGNLKIKSSKDKYVSSVIDIGKNLFGASKINRPLWALDSYMNIHAAMLESQRLANSTVDKFLNNIIKNIIAW